jgi:hypothetical protein
MLLLVVFNRGGADEQVSRPRWEHEQALLPITTADSKDFKSMHTLAFCSNCNCTQRLVFNRKGATSRPQTQMGTGA